MTKPINNPLDRKNVMLDGEMFDYFDHNNNIQIGGGVMPTQPSQPKSSSDYTAALSTAGSIAQSSKDIGVNIITGIMQKRDNDAARKEARELADITRQDQLKQQNIELSFRKKQIEQEEQQMQLQQTKDAINQRFSIWQNKFQKEIQNMNKARESAIEFKQRYSQLDEEKRQMLIQGMI